jgi:hypothetical protein
MTEQELRVRAAVAEYDEELARFGDWEFGSELYCEDDALYWRIQDSTISREQGSLMIECDVIGTHAATMRAMDAAAKAFQEALRCDNARGGK